MLDVNRLRVFRSVVASGSVSAAASSLGYTPSAVSQHINALQRETGLTLFEKNGRGIQATVQGRELASRSDEVMAAMASLDEVVDDLRTGRTGALIIGTFASVSEHWLPRVAATVMREFPDTRLNIELTDPPVSGHRPDVDVRSENPAEPPRVPAGYTRIELALEPYVLLVNRDHPLAGRRHVQISELADETFISDDVVEGACYRILQDAWRAGGFTPRSFVQTATHHAAVRCVEAGLGVCAMPRLASRAATGEVVTLALVDPTPQRRIVVNILDAARSHPATARLIDLLRDAARAG